MFDLRVTVRALARTRTLTHTLAHYDPQGLALPSRATRESALLLPRPSTQVYVSEARVIIQAS